MLLTCECSCCGNIGEYELSEEETVTFIKYKSRVITGYLQDLFPNVPAWIRSGAIDMKAGGFCICPECCGM